MPAHHNRRNPALLPDDFAQTGLLIRRTGPVPKRFQVLGERSSGTNYLSRLLSRNSTMESTEAAGWKHGHPSALAIPADVAVICLVRHAEDWARSMHSKPWHATPALQELGFSAFLRAPWTSIVDRARYFEAKSGLVGQPLQADRDPLTGKICANLFALRRSKLTGLLTYLNRDCTMALVRLEALQAEPEAMTNRLLAALGLPARTAPFKGVNKRLGAKFKPAIPVRPMTPDRFSEADRAFMISQLDLELEARLGYRYRGDVTTS
ncbi:hypothetical protein [Seohaeicola zhoushanensis]|uniref:Uncharacterized protein n=1 Tax=Seohaeicola zhoushanensis TaxID=1569283 RepID=A0A8J3GXZ8_9RHOB|nr:hypothetical protein [Seohaeicola zhoushanensis]GHF55850.1 hypothetical protein GCM10017056_29220 [Seohaeicola zhoushanensis]